MTDDGESTGKGKRQRLSWTAWIFDTVWGATKDLSRAQISLAVAVGVVGGLFPIPGATTVITGVLSAVTGCNLAASQLINVALTPLMLACFPFFIRFGRPFWEGSTASAAAEPPGLLEALAEDFWGALQVFKSSLIGGIVGWVVLSPVIFAVAYGAVHLATGLLGGRAQNKKT